MTEETKNEETKEPAGEATKEPQSVLDLASKTEGEIPEAIGPEELQRVQDMAQTIDHLLRAIGSMENQKSKMLVQVNLLQEKVEHSAKDSMLKAGILEANIEEYRVELSQGKIVKNSELRKNDQKIRPS